MNTEHAQVDTGLGFTVDEELVGLVQMFWRVGIYTDACCQAEEVQAEYSGARRVVWFSHPDTMLLMRFCLHVRWWLLRSPHGAWTVKIVLTNEVAPPEPTAVIEYTSDLDGEVMAAVSGWRDGRRD